MKRSGSMADGDSQLDAFFRRLLDKSARQRLPELFTSSPHGDALYHIHDRGGVSVVALRTSSLTHDQLIQIMTYRLAQYVMLGYVNNSTVYEAGLEYEPLEYVDPDDIHVIAGATE